MTRNTQKLMTQNVRAAYAAARRRKVDRAIAANLCEVFAEAIASLDTEDMDVLLTVDHDVDPDNIFSTPPRKVA